MLGYYFSKKGRLYLVAKKQVDNSKRILDPGIAIAKRSGAVWKIVNACDATCLTRLPFKLYMIEPAYEVMGD